MNPQHADAIRHQIDALYRSEGRRVFASLVRLVGGFDQAEEAMHEAFAAAVERWPVDGVPKNPRAWLVSTGRFKAIDTVRRRARFDGSLPLLAEKQNERTTSPEDFEDASLRDDQLRLIFTCCHPALAPTTQIALTLREVCGLTTEEVASAFLTQPPTIAQRIVRGKAKIRDARIPYEVPSVVELPERLDSVLAVIYLVFNEGYSASRGDKAVRRELTAEAIRLCRLLVELLPDPEAQGLLALMLLHDARRESRATADGDLVLLEDQDRGRWDRPQIDEGTRWVQRALQSRRFGVYTLQAAIAAVHAGAPSAAQTNWAEIVALYDVLLRAETSPIIELNRAVAVAMRDGPEAGLDLIDAILARNELTEYHLAHAARADLCRRLRRIAEARESYTRALELATQTPERRFLERRLNELEGTFEVGGG